MQTRQFIFFIMVIISVIGCKQRTFNRWNAISKDGEVQEGRLDRWTYPYRLPKELEENFSGVYREWTHNWIQVFETRWETGKLSGITIEFDTNGVPITAVPYVDYQVSGKVFDLSLQDVEATPDEIAGSWVRIKTATNQDKPSISGEQLVIKNNGEFNFTRSPFETYKDYWGIVRYSPDNKRIKFYLLDGNWIPPEFDGDGEYDFNENQLVLNGLNLAQVSF